MAPKPNLWAKAKSGTKDAAKNKGLPKQRKSRKNKPSLKGAK